MASSSTSEVSREDFLPIVYSQAVAIFDKRPSTTAKIDPAPLIGLGFREDEKKKWITLACNEPLSEWLDILQAHLQDRIYVLPVSFGMDEMDACELVLFASVHKHFVEINAGLKAEDRFRHADVWRWFDLIQTRYGKYIKVSRVDFNKHFTAALLVESSDHHNDKGKAKEKGNGKDKGNNKKNDDTVEDGAKSEKKSKKTKEDVEKEITNGVAGVNIADGSKDKDKELTPEEEEARREAQRLKKEAKKAEKAAKKPVEEPAGASATKSDDADDLDPYRVDIRVGRILKAEKHPEAEKLYVEQIDVGDEGGVPRTVCSGLVKHIPDPNDLLGLCLVVCNLKPAKMVGIQSDGMVLAATDSETGHVVLVMPPEGSRIGERVQYQGLAATVAQPDEQLNNKKKHFEKISAHYKTNGDGFACYKDHVWTTLAGICAAPAIKNGAIK